MVSILLMEEVLDQLRLVVYPSIYNISRSPCRGGSGLGAQHYSLTSKIPSKQNAKLSNNVQFIFLIVTKIKRTFKINFSSILPDHRARVVLPKKTPFPPFCDFCQVASLDQSQDHSFGDRCQGLGCTVWCQFGRCLIT